MNKRKIIKSISLEILLFCVLLTLSMSIISPYRRELYKVFRELSSEQLDTIYFAIRASYFVIASLAWCIIMCLRLYIKSIIQSK